MTTDNRMVTPVPVFMHRPGPRQLASGRIRQDARNLVSSLPSSVTVHTVARSKSGVSYRRPRTRSLVHCVFHDPRQRGVPCSSTAF